MSNQFLKLRRSSVPGKVPTTSSLEFGEIALNTYDGLLFIKKSGSLGEEIVTISSNSSSLVTSASYAITASYALNAGFFSSVSNQISSGSVSASVNVGNNSIFLIQSSSQEFFKISASNEINLYSDIFIIKNFATKQPVLTISESVVKFATQSFDPVSSTEAGSIWFTSTNFYVGLE